MRFCKKDLTELLPILQAMEEGKPIQSRLSKSKNWEDLSLNYEVYDLNLDICEYRIKPELQLVPFTFEDAEFLIGKAIKVKEGCSTSLFHGVCAMITVVGNKGVDIGGRGSDPATYDTLLNYFTFLDGTPCGKLTETSNK